MKNRVYILDWHRCPHSPSVWYIDFSTSGVSFSLFIVRRAMLTLSALCNSNDNCTGAQREPRCCPSRAYLPAFDNPAVGNGLQQALLLGAPTTKARATTSTATPNDNNKEENENKNEKRQRKQDNGTSARTSKKKTKTKTQEHENNNVPSCGR